MVMVVVSVAVVVTSLLATITIAMAVVTVVAVIMVVVVVVLVMLVVVVVIETVVLVVYFNHRNCYVWKYIHVTIMNRVNPAFHIPKVIDIMRTDIYPALPISLLTTYVYPHKDMLLALCCNWNGPFSYYLRSLVDCNACEYFFSANTLEINCQHWTDIESQCHFRIQGNKYISFPSQQ